MNRLRHSLEIVKVLNIEIGKLETISSVILGEHKLSGVSGIDAEKLDDTME